MTEVAAIEDPEQKEFELKMSKLIEGMPGEVKDRFKVLKVQMDQVNAIDEEEDKEYFEPAKAFVAKLRDVTEFLAGIDFNRELGTLRIRATYQDPCHLGHAQRHNPRRWK